MAEFDVGFKIVAHQAGRAVRIDVGAGKGERHDGSLRADGVQRIRSRGTVLPGRPACHGFLNASKRTRVRYSARITSAGSTRLARRAGSQLAAAATASSIPVAPA